MDRGHASLAALLVSRYIQQVTQDEEEELALIAAYVQKVSHFTAAYASALATRTPRSVWSVPRRSSFFEEAMEREDVFVDKFRISPATFRHVVKSCGHLERVDTKLRVCIPLRERVAIALYFLATGDSYRAVADSFGRSRSTVCVSVREFCETLVDGHMKRAVQMPRTQDDCARIMRGFEEVSGLPHCVGALGGIHIPILGPKKNPMHYRNHKGWHSVVMQGVVDDDFRFLDVHVGYPGGANDAKVLTNSELCHRAEAGALIPVDVPCEPLTIQVDNGSDGAKSVDIKCYLVGDGEYLLTDWLVKPYDPTDVALSEQQIAFNFRLERARSKVERAFKILKARFRCLRTSLSVDVDQVPTFVAACVILHNWCLERGDVFRDVWLEEVDDRRQPTSGYFYQQTPGGEVIREALRQHCENLDRN